MTMMMQMISVHGQDAPGTPQYTAVSPEFIRIGEWRDTVGEPLSGVVARFKPDRYAGEVCQCVSCVFRCPVADVVDGCRVAVAVCDTTGHFPLPLPGARRSGNDGNVSNRVVRAAIRVVVW